MTRILREGTSLPPTLEPLYCPRCDTLTVWSRDGKYAPYVCGRCGLREAGLLTKEESERSQKHLKSLKETA